MAASAGKAALRVALGAIVVMALATTSTAKAGLISTGSASYCDPSSTQAFGQWGDSARYTLLPNGSFENSSASWALSGGARVVDGNEPFFLRQRTDRHSLYLPQGSSASSATMCFALGDWHLRFVMRNAGSATGSLRVSVIVPTVDPSRPAPPGRPRPGSRSCSATSRAWSAPGPSPSASHRSGAAPPSRSTMSIWIPGSAPERSRALSA